MKKILILLSILFLMTPFLIAQDNRIFPLGTFDNRVPFRDCWMSLDMQEKLLLTIGIQHGLMASYLLVEHYDTGIPPGFRLLYKDLGIPDIKSIREYGQDSLSSTFLFVQGGLMTPLEILLRIDRFLKNEKHHDLSLQEIIYRIFANKNENLLIIPKE